MGLLSTHADHDVLFSEREGLAAVVGEQLSTAHAAGGTVIVIATPAHRDAFTAEMAARGVDVDGAVAARSLVLLDAADTLSRLTPEGVLQQQAFDEVIGGLVRGAAARGRVQAFGEMVGLLWEAGRAMEAIELERFWGSLVSETSIALLCAYPSALVDDHELAAEFARVCRLHSVVVSEIPFERTWALPDDVEAAAQARRLVANALRARGLGDAELDTARVVVAELVANALLHGQPPFSLSVSIEAGNAILEVRDGGDVLPDRAIPADDDGCHGLEIVRTLSRWGADKLSDGKRVWAAIDRR